MTDALATHYAQALADAVFGSDSGLSPEEAVQQIAAAANLVAQSKQLQIALLSPAVNRAQKAVVVDQIANDAGWHRLVRNFLKVLVSHRRVRELSSIRQAFEAVVDARIGWVPAEIASAHPLSEEQKKAVEGALSGQLGKSIRAHYSVDASLLGGIRARAAGVEYDASMRGKLEALRDSLGRAR